MLDALNVLVVALRHFFQPLDAGGSIYSVQYVHKSGVCAGTTVNNAGMRVNKPEQLGFSRVPFQTEASIIRLLEIKRGLSVLLLYVEPHNSISWCQMNMLQLVNYVTTGYYCHPIWLRPFFYLH